MIRHPLIWIFSSALSALAIGFGCGGKVVLEADGSSGNGGAGGLNTTGPGPTGPGSTSSVGAGGAAQCGQTFDGFKLDFQTQDGTVWGCGYDISQQGEVAFFAEVLEAWEEGMIINTCSPTSNCFTNETLFLSAPGLKLSIPFGTYVQISLSVYKPWGCEHHIVIKNLPQWDGVQNPYFSDERLFLAAGDGSPVPLQGAPFWVETIPLNCYPDMPPGCTIKDDYLLRFFQIDQEGNSVTVPMGSTASWKILIPDGGYPYTVRNLRSFETGNCDDYWNWGYYVALESPDP